MKDTDIENLWLELSNVAVAENEDGELVLDQDFDRWKKGDYLYSEVWKWFDKEHSKGLNYLMNEFEG